jgi:hypothetical protein
MKRVITIWKLPLHKQSGETRNLGKGKPRLGRWGKPGVLSKLRGENP